ncbi:hypothetical protein FQN57_001936 [Myotisia sp. PD_48]|nr:hypothetical protein FQN57_001936 [Myotisia sp. PD_48]
MVAIGICACGSATGGLIFTAMFQQLLPKLGFGWTMRAFAFVTTACLTLCNFLARPRVPPRKTGPFLELAAFKEASYALFAIGIFLTFWGVYFAFYYLSSFGIEIIHITQLESLNMILILSGIGIIGRIAPAYVADRYTGSMNILLLVTLASIICAFGMIGVTSRGGLYAWSSVYGILGNAVQGMFPATLSSLTTDLQKAGVKMGMIFTIVSFAVLTGPPIGGSLITRDNGGYLYAQLFAAISMLVGFFLLCGARFAVTGRVLFGLHRIYKYKNGKYGKLAWGETLPLCPSPTSQRSEMTAIIFAQEEALNKLEELVNNPVISVTIFSDSKYAANCMTDWVKNWAKNGWVKSSGQPVANQDLLKKAFKLDKKLEREGEIKYVWVPREENWNAHRVCEAVLDKQETDYQVDSTIYPVLNFEVANTNARFFKCE